MEAGGLVAEHGDVYVVAVHRGVVEPRGVAGPVVPPPFTVAGDRPDLGVEDHVRDTELGAVVAEPVGELPAVRVPAARLVVVDHEVDGSAGRVVGQRVGMNAAEGGDRRELAVDAAEGDQRVPGESVLGGRTTRPALTELLVGSGAAHHWFGRLGGDTVGELLHDRTGGGFPLGVRAGISGALDGLRGGGHAHLLPAGDVGQARVVGVVGDAVERAGGEVRVAELGVVAPAR